MNEVNELIKQADALFEKKEYKKIIDLLPDEILIKHNNAYLYAWRAWAHNRLKQYEKALEHAEKAIIADPNNSFGYYQRGGVWYASNDYDRAISDFNKAIELKSDYARFYVSKGYSLHFKGKYDEAIANFNRAIELEKDFAYAYAARGYSFMYLKEYDKAIVDFDKAIELEGDEPSYYYDRGIFFAEKKQFDMAIADYDLAIELDPNIAISYLSRGKAFYAVGNFQKAIDDFQKAILHNKEFDYLEKDIKLAKEKQQERITLENSKADPKDKDEKSKIEKEIELLINKIRELSKSEVKTVVHYTKVFVADIYVTGPGSKMHYSNAIYMNDPMEGKAFFNYLNDEKIRAAYLNGEKRTETSVYLGSFLPAEENDGEISHEDELVMWRTYGKDENGKEASGCSVVLSSDFFKIKTSKKDEFAKVEISEELLNVIYLKNLKHEKKVTNDPKEKIAPAIESLKEQLILFIELRDNYQPIDDFYKDIENSIFKQLSTISYLFKSSDYNYEHEVRVITYMPRDSELIKFMTNTEFNAPRKRFYIESYNEILPFVKKIFLGPKVENYQQWSLYFDFEIRQRAREISLMPHPPYKIKPSDIEIMKSDCKFQ
ncbi:MAG TPA: tetratricopeptide repeat protein [Prolixibacteraceae bacterium]|nr:tetratricopeptide repeat protein [Prolixibacteraceae bacterium]